MRIPTALFLSRLLLPSMILGGLFAAGSQTAFAQEGARGESTPQKIDYRRDIEPILSVNCLRCHGPDEHEGGLRLDVKDRFLQGGDNGPVIEPGKGADSELVRRVSTDDTDERMPPEGKPLSGKQIALLRAWIDDGVPGLPENAPQAHASKHWAFQPVVRPRLPDDDNRDWARNAIDHFVLAKLDEQNVRPSAEAARETLIRRLSLDLLGVLPEWQRVERFANDERPEAYAQLVDELLASPHFGERWGRHWLDLARYADSTGYESDKPREIWPYRDWVISALNDNMPFDRFVIEQIGGDLLPNATKERVIATGFHCNAMLDPGVRWESIVDRVNTTGSVFLGLTLGCAQCHSHKTDPVTQREFFQLYAFFNDATVDTMELVLTSQSNPSIQTANTLVMKHTPQKTHIFVRGDPAQPGQEVTAGVPAFLHDLNVEGKENPDRVDLARWLVAPDNPLTPRVTVNRIWQRYLGLGLVETESDFGKQTPAPMHKDLLDFLASDFRSSGWNLKRLHRLIVTSATYRQSSDVRQDLLETDPRNALLARQQRLRLETEVIRDVSLDAGGLIATKIGGPSVFPHQPDGVLDNRATPATWTMSDGQDRYRRGMYTWVWRLTQHPHLPLFDAPDGITACSRRDRSNVPIQALTLLNDPTFVTCAQALAARILIEPVANDVDRIRRLFRICLSRDPAPEEVEIVSSTLLEQRMSLGIDSVAAQQIVGTARRKDVPLGEQAAWNVVCRTVLNLDEFITRE